MSVRRKAEQQRHPDLKLLTVAQVKGIQQHKYASQDHSLLSKYVLCYWWNILLKWIPMWLAPNAITLFGLSVNIGTTLYLACFAPWGTESAPWHAYMACGVGLFIYQSLDAVDGKHARRTGTGTPLGELFDHGCDAISTGFLVLGVVTALKYGDWSLAFWAMLEISFAFYCSHWFAYCMGHVEFGVVDVTEAQIGIFVTHLLAATYGPDFFENKIFGYSGREILLVMFLGGTAVMILRVFVSIVRMPDTKPTTAGTSVYTPMIPVFICMVPILQAKGDWEDFVVQVYPAIWILTIGAMMAKLTTKLVVAHMTRTPLKFFDRCHLIALAMAVAVTMDLLPLSIVWFAGFVASHVDLVTYCVMLCRDMSDVFDIPVLSMPPDVLKKM
eukprot:Clim_evm39s156 gene=Clim_evmTU39s156